MRKSISIRAPFEAISGYGQIIYNLFNNENLFDYDIQFYSTRPISDLSKHNISKTVIERLKDDYQKDRPNIELLIHPIQMNQEQSNIFSHIPYSKNRLFFTMWETDRITEYWAYIMSTKCISVITPNQWNIDAFEKEGVTVPMQKCPLFANDIYQYKTPQNNDKLIIGISSSVIDERKNILPFINKFNESFQNNDNVELWVKTTKSNVSKIPKYLNKNLKIFAQSFDTEELMNWYHSIDVLVSPTKSEGWGMMQHEAMMCGRPVMCAHYGGLLEFVNEKNSIPIKFNEEFPEDTYFAYSNGRWANPDLDDCMNKIKWCMRNKHKLIHMGIEAHNSVKHLTLKNTINTLNSIIADYAENIDLSSSDKKSDKGLPKSNKRTK